MPTSLSRKSNGHHTVGGALTSDWWRRQAITNGKPARHTEPRFGAHWSDYLVMGLLGLAVFVFVVNVAQRIPDWLLAGRDYFDVWFDGDSPRYLMHMTDRHSDVRDRSFMHPLLSYAYFPVLAVRMLFHMEPYAAVRVFLGLVGTAWVMAMYALLRLMTLQRLDATLLVLLGAVSASAMFWFTVPESWALGSLSIVLALIVVPISQHRRLSVRWYILTSALTVAISVTNWMLGIIIAFVKFAWRRALWVTLAAFGAIAFVCVVNAFIFPTFKIAFPEYAHEYIFQAEGGGIFHVFTAFVWHPIIAPAFRVMSGWDHPNVLCMTFQQMVPGSAGGWGAVAVVLWTGLLGLGVWAAANISAHPMLRRVVGWMLLGQFMLHTIYGAEEVFLYSMHWLPCLLVVVGCVMLTRLRSFALVLTVALILCAGVNNIRQLNSAILFAGNEDAIRGRFDAPRAFDRSVVRSQAVTSPNGAHPKRRDSR